MSSNFNYPFQRGTESLPTEPNQRLGGIRPSGNEINDNYYQEVIERNSALIEMFIRQSRQEADLSGLDIYSNQEQFPEFNASYIRQFGKEHVNISPIIKRPIQKKEKREEIIRDIMLDGYLAVIVYSDPKPDDWVKIENPGTTDERHVQQLYHTDIIKIKLNNELLTTHQVNPNQTELLLFRFGKHAMKFHSYRNTLNPNEQLQAILPIRTEETSQLKQELFAYFLYDRAFMKALYQQKDLLTQYAGFSLDEKRDIYEIQNDLNFKVIDMGEFAVDLLNKLENVLEITSTYKKPAQNEEPLLEDNFGIRGTVVCFGEFFDRNPDTFRFVNQSWTYPQGVYNQIEVNDKPLKLFALCNDSEDNFGTVKITYESGVSPFIGKLSWGFNLSTEVSDILNLSSDMVGDNLSFPTSGLPFVLSYSGRNKSITSLTTYDYSGTPENSTLQGIAGEVFFDKLISSGTYFVSEGVSTDYGLAYIDWRENHQDLKYTEDTLVKSIITDWYKFVEVFRDRADFIEEDNWVK